MAPTAARRARSASCMDFSVKRNGDISRQQPLPRHMIELEPDAVGIFEQNRIVAGRPLILARRADDPGIERAQKCMQFVDVGALAGAEAQMVQADALLFEPGPFML